MKKKMVFALVALIVLVACCVTAFALYTTKNRTVELQTMEVEESEVFALSGEVVEVTEAYFVIEDAQYGDIQVNFDETTVFDGAAADSIKVGEYVFVDYNGQMTRSLPAQVFALRVSMHVVTGEVEEVAEESVTIRQEDADTQLVLHLPEGAPELAVGTKIKAYTSGATTMSLPPQTSAMKIAVILE